MLEEYYNLRIKTDIPFYKLTDKHKRIIENSFGFAVFKVHKAKKQFDNACRIFIERRKQKNIKLWHLKR